jgi:chromosome partitioning protein
MIIVTAAQQKGGVGKTNAICHLAFYYSQVKSLRTLVIELDPQGNAGHTLEAYKTELVASALFEQQGKDFPQQLLTDSKLTVIAGDDKLVNIEAASLSVGDMFAENLAALDSQYDVCLIDTAPSLGVKMSVALYVSHYVFTPIEMAKYSMTGVQKMYTTIENMREYNPNLVFLGLLPSKIDMRVASQRANLAQLRADHSDKLMPCKIALRTTIADALDAGMPVWDIKKRSAKPAATEIMEFATYISEKIGV